MKNFYSFLIAAALAIPAAEAKEVAVVTPGTLSSIIGNDEKYKLTELAVDGEINGTDVLFLREMAGADINGDKTEGSLNTLDLSRAKIVGGGTPYFHHALYGDISTTNGAVGDYMFYGCESLADFTFPTGATAVGSASFYGCTGLKRADLPDAVTTLGENAFQGCNSLQTITIGSGMQSIAGTFYGCPALKSITVSVANGNYADIDGVLTDKAKTKLLSFPSAKAADYAIPQGISTICSYAFFESEGLEKVTISPDVRLIDQRAFQSCLNLKEVVFNEGVETINDFAFLYCQSIRGIKLPNSLKSIGEQAFSGCESAATLTFGSGMTHLGSGSFSSCRSLECVEIPDNLSDIDDGVFAYCTSLKQVKLGASMKSVPEQMFSDCTALDNVIIPDNITLLGNDSFCRCISLKNINFGNGVKEIGNNCFASCTSLAELVFPESVEKIGEGVVSNCTALRRMVIPDKVTKLGAYLCAYCFALETVELGEGLETVAEGLFSGCENLKEVKLGSNTREIGPYAFMSCSYFEHIDLPESIEKIGDYAFSSCNFSTICIPAGVQNIGMGAFAYNYNLADVYCYATEPPTCQMMAFNMIADEAKLHVPSGSSDAYADAEEWKNFYSIIEDATTGITPQTISHATIVARTCKGGIAVSGDADTACTIYTLNGQVAAKGRADGSLINLVPGIYIVKVGTHTMKVPAK